MDKTRLKMAFIGDSLTEGIVGASYFEILKSRLPRHDLFNFGKGGDTVVSLLRRLHRIDFGIPMDIGFLWIGVNDVLIKTSRSFPVVKRLRKQPWVKNHPEFREFYRSVLELLQDRISRIFTLPPLFIGEDLDNEWNRELAVLSDIIRDLSGTFPNVEFFGWRERFSSHLASKNISPYAPKSAFRVISDALFPKTHEALEKRASARGLHLTIDGIHLNATGAEKVAEAILEKIRSEFPVAVCDA